MIMRQVRGDKPNEVDKYAPQEIDAIAYARTSMIYVCMRESLKGTSEETTQNNPSNDTE